MTFAAYDEQAIWGTGATPEAAIDDAAHVVAAGGNCAFDLDDNGTLQVAQ